eukprot:3044602-Alexandrium_andersonii.AAC.1
MDLVGRRLWQRVLRPVPWRARCRLAPVPGWWPPQWLEGWAGRDQRLPLAQGWCRRSARHRA